MLLYRKKKYYPNDIKVQKMLLYCTKKMLLYNKKMLLYDIKVQKVLFYDTKKCYCTAKKILLYNIKGVTLCQKRVILWYKMRYSMT